MQRSAAYRPTAPAPQLADTDAPTAPRLHHQLSVLQTPASADATCNADLPTDATTRADFHDSQALKQLRVKLQLPQHYLPFILGQDVDQHQSRRCHERH